MNRRWKELPLSAAPVQIVDGDRGKNYPKLSDFSESGHCLFLNAGNVTSNGFDFSKCQFIDEGKDQALGKGRLSRGDVVMTTRGTIGNVAYFDENVPYDNIRINSGMVIFRTAPDRLSSAFFYHFLRSPEFAAQTRSLRSGVAQPQLPIRDMKHIHVPLPDLLTACRITSILSAYDDLIENNRRRMKLLEDAARLLHEEWFVRLRFPGHERVRVKDGVPEGWLRKRIGDIADCVGGGTPSTTVPAYWEDGTVTWVTPTDVTRNQHFVLLDTEKRITEAGLNNSSAKLVPPHTVLMTSRASVGFFAVAGREVCTNQGFISIVPQDAALSTYLLFHLSERVEEIRAMGSGSTYPEVSRGKFRELSVVTPPTRLVADFDEQATLLLRHIRVLKQQNEKLRAARDLLLPRLMSGEVNVSRKDRNATEIHS
jgi:type I restriction enzyme S subunit